MKKRIIIVFIAISVMFKSDLYCQITISPEIGLSYLPFERLGYLNKMSNRKDLLLGLSGELALSNVFYFQMSLSYVFREDYKYYTQAEIRNYDYSKYEYDDLNIDLSLVYKYKNIWINIGPSMIRKLNTRLYSDFKNGDRIYDNPSNYQYGAHVGIGIELSKMKFNIDYMRKIYDVKYMYYDQFFRGVNRVNISFSYPLISGGK